jgi:hypothetical protein
MDKLKESVNEPFLENANLGKIGEPQNHCSFCISRRQRSALYTLSFQEAIKSLAPTQQLLRMQFGDILLFLIHQKLPNERGVASHGAEHQAHDLFRPFRVVTQYLVDGYEIGERSGNSFSEDFAMQNYFIASFHTGTNLEG